MHDAKEVDVVTSDSGSKAFLVGRHRSNNICYALMLVAKHAASLARRYFRSLLVWHHEVLPTVRPAQGDLHQYGYFTKFRVWLEETEAPII